MHPRFHARRTGGIPSLLPLCYDLPLRLSFASYGARQKQLKDHGVYNQARCRVRGWELHETDAVRVKESNDPELILQHLPKRIFVEMERKTFPRYQDLTEHWVPLPVTTTVWHLDRNEAIRIKRRGFACSPDFSSTIHSATGRTLSACVPDLGTIDATPNPQTAM